MHKNWQDQIEVVHELDVITLGALEEDAHSLALAIAYEEVSEELYLRLDSAADKDESLYNEDGEIDVLDFYTETELDMMARDMVDIYDNDEHRAECWRYARFSSVDANLERMRPIGKKLPEKARGSQEKWLESLPDEAA